MRAFVREPLVHFLVLGALLFAWFEWRGGEGPGSTRITVGAGIVEHLAAGFEKTWRRAPTDAELKGLVDDYVKEEMATREAVAMGLDRDDTIIRRRLRQKMEFLLEDAVAGTPPTEAELQAWLDAHREAFRTPPQLSLRQVFVGERSDPAAARAEAGRLLVRLRAAGPEARIDQLGDPSMLPQELPLGPVSAVVRTFGKEFARRLEDVEPGSWAGPLESPYGLHLVLVSQRVAASDPALAEVRQIVERELLAERRKQQLEALYARLLEKYEVTIEMPEEAPPSSAQQGSP